jgi:hypothetical protein
MIPRNEFQILELSMSIQFPSEFDAFYSSPFAMGGNSLANSCHDMSFLRGSIPLNGVGNPLPQ